MPYATADARQQILDALARSADELNGALARLSAAYELLDERTAERLEDELFGPVKRAYGRARRAHEAFARRHELSGRAFEPAAAAAPGHGAQGLMEAAAGHVGAADATLGGLQDSMLPVEVGDELLRADIEQVRRLLSDYGARSRALLRTLGR